MKYELNEILWEFTLKCNKNCKYCGSKNVLNKENKSKYTQEKIAEYITKVKPESVTITGGEPSCEINKLRKCVKILSDSKIKVKILTNGNLFKEVIGVSDDLYCMVDHYGLSINTIEDINIAKKNRYDKFIDKTTVITNFGLHNINDFDTIAKYAIQFPCWQVQLTMGNELQLDLKQINELNDKINKYKDLFCVIKADNFNCGKCTAGINSFSITYDGMIIPCLSYRSWKSNLMIQGEVKDIVKIWKKGFEFNRNREFVPCCKDITGIKKVCSCSFDNIQEVLRKEEKKETPADIYVYGVAIPTPNDYNHIQVYGVGQGPQVIDENDNKDIPF